MFDSILIPLDGSSLAECVLPQAKALVQAFHPNITLLHVMDNAIKGGVTAPPSALDWQLRQMEAERYLTTLSDRLHAFEEIKDDSIEIRIVEGTAADSILDWALKHENDLIVLGSHGRGGPSPWHISSVAQKVIARAAASVAIVRVDQNSVNGNCVPADADQLRFKRVLVPMDGSQRAECVLPVAATLANQHGAQIVLAHIVHRPDMPGRTPPSPELLDITEQFVERNRIEAEQYLQELKSRLPGEVETRVRVSENISATLHEIVANDAIDLVLMSAHGYSGQSRWPQGSVTTNVIAHGTTSLLIVQDMTYIMSNKNRVLQTQAPTSPAPNNTSIQGHRDTILVGGR